MKGPPYPEAPGPPLASKLCFHGLPPSSLRWSSSSQQPALLKCFLPLSTKPSCCPGVGQSRARGPLPKASLWRIPAHVKQALGLSSVPCPLQLLLGPSWCWGLSPGKLRHGLLTKAPPCHTLHGTLSVPGFRCRDRCSLGTDAGSCLPLPDKYVWSQVQGRKTVLLDDRGLGLCSENLLSDSHRGRKYAGGTKRLALGRRQGRSHPSWLCGSWQDASLLC